MQAVTTAVLAYVRRRERAAFIHAARKAWPSKPGATWHLGQEANWSADLDAVSIAFAGGTVAAIQVVGTYNLADGSFVCGAGL